jgi:hypothetical protein
MRDTEILAERWELLERKVAEYNVQFLPQQEDLPEGR